MKQNEVFPSNYLKADDLGGKAVTVTIESVELETIGQGADKDTKPVVSFTGKEKKLVINKTNFATIAKVTGEDDTDNWPGKKIILVAREVDFQGKPCLAIRVSLQKPGASSPAPKQAEPEQEEESEAPF